MRLRPLKNTKELINNCEYLINEPENNINKWNKIFKNDNPIYIEIGMGLGKFIYENALKYPNINFIGIEKFDIVISRAIKKMNKLEKLDNLFLIKTDAKELPLIFNKEIDKIYLNFSDPWPKKRHIKNRLTSDSFIEVYKKICRNNIVIEQKTDNIDLFNYSIENLENNNFEVKSCIIDNNNIMTEYEEKFNEKGIKINKLIAIRR